MTNDSKITAPREVTLDSAIQRHQVAQYLRALGVEWTVDESLPGDRAAFRFDATDTQWDDIQAWVKKVTS